MLNELAVISGILTGTLGTATAVTTIFDQTFSVMTGSRYSKVVKSPKSKDVNANYYTSGFSSEEERLNFGKQVCESLVAEGAVLLKNENHALPLSKGSRLSCFSHSSVDIVYGGTGSGSTDSSKAVTLKSALQSVGFEVNETLWSFYTEGSGKKFKRSTRNLMGFGTHMINEVPWSEYTDTEKNSISTYNDAALIVFSRVGGEGTDLPTTEGSDSYNGNFLALNKEERELLRNISAMKANGEIKKVIVLLNSANALQLDFLNDTSYDIDACLWIGDVGQTGLSAVAKILCGDIVPSGHLADTFCYNNLSSPASANFGSSKYSNADSVKMNARPSESTNYIVYAEGIYVGYRYYETRYEDMVMRKGNTEGYNYHNDVAYPFGYGLSYTTFSYKNLKVTYDKSTDVFQVCVDVTNTGETYSGKDVVEIYSQSPYTEYDQLHHIEKSSVKLCGFAKTKVLAPGETQTVFIQIDRRDLASYDAYNQKTYILEDGTYYLTVGADAHDAVNNILAAKGFSPESTDGRMDTFGNVDLVYTYVNDTFDYNTYASAKNGEPITNQFDNADMNLYDAKNQSITYVSRSNWSATLSNINQNLKITSAMVSDLADRRTNINKPTSQKPKTNTNNLLKAIELRGLSFDDPKWDTLLDQLTYKEMSNFVGNGFHITKALKSVALPDTKDENGPNGLTASLLKVDLNTTSFPSEDIMAASWNIDLLKQLGKCIGEDCLTGGYSGLYGPGANIHRTPYGGRNFEYYSEDPYLSAKMVMHEVKEIQRYGVYVMMKHCNLNEGETDRGGICTWANEQSIREIYLRAFQDTLENVEYSGVMTSYSRLGCIWNGAHPGLLSEVLRREWGAKGIIISDNTEFHSYMDGIEGVLAGTTLYDGMTGKQYRQILKEGKNSNFFTQKLREASHYNIYTIVNSNAMNGITAHDDIVLTTPIWKKALQLATVISAILFIVSIISLFFV